MKSGLRTSTPPHSLRSCLAVMQGTVRKGGNGNPPPPLTSFYWPYGFARVCYGAGGGAGDAVTVIEAFIPSSL